MDKGSVREKREFERLLLKHFIAGTIRYEPFQAFDYFGELCFEGIRHCAQLDEEGCAVFDRNLLQRMRLKQQRSLS